MQSGKIYLVRFWRFFRGLLSVSPGFRQKRHQPLSDGSRNRCYVQSKGEKVQIDIAIF